MPRRSGFTLMEMMITAGLMSFLAILVSSAWVGFGRSMADSSRRCRIAQEANIAFEALARDLNGQQPDSVTGDRAIGREVGRLIVGGSQWMLCFDGEPANGIADWAAPDTVLTYEVLAGQLVRRNESTGAEFVVASNVEQLDLLDETDGTRVTLTLRYRDLTRTFTLVAKDP